jgi:hypothetical protein
MQVMKVDGRHLMLNEQESKYWTDTGNFKRIPEGDDEDAEYCEMRDRMIGDGNQYVYNSVVPPEQPTPPMLLPR